MKQLWQHDHIFDAEATDVNRLCSTGESAAYHHVYDVRFTGSPTTVSLFIEHSVNGADWTTLGSEVTAAGRTQVDTVLARYIRFRLATLSGGTSPKVVVKYMGVPS